MSRSVDLSDHVLSRLTPAEKAFAERLLVIQNEEQARQIEQHERPRFHVSPGVTAEELERKRSAQYSREGYVTRDTLS